MSLPFTPDDFFEVFAAYNRALWPAVIALWLYALLGATLLARSKRAGRLIAVMLAAQWAWTAIAYHVVFLPRINPAAWLFGGLFLLQSALFAWFGIIHNELRFSARGSTRHRAAWATIGYSLAYPFIAQASASEVFHAPWFGVPCPTTLLTIGFLFAADPPWPRVLVLIPAAWSIIGGSAAVLLGVPADLMLWVAAATVGGYALWSSGFGRSVRASPLEKGRRLPGDQLIEHPMGSLDHAITIRRPRAAVWPWLAQMGAGSRAGWYSYDVIDNGGSPSAAGIIPHLQQLSVDMIFPALPGVTDAFTLLGFERGRYLILGWVDTKGTRLMTWAFILEDVSGGSTRLIVRARAGPGFHFHRLPWPVAKWIVAVLHFIMQRRQLRGIARRAEMGI